MSFWQILYYLLYGKTIYQTSKPLIEWSVDGAESGRFGIWKCDWEKDDMTPNSGFGIEELTAKDWAYKD